MRILIVAVQYPPSPETGAKRPWLLAKEFCRLGHDVTVLSRQERAVGDSPRKFSAETGAFGERVLRVAECAFAGVKDASFRTFWAMRSIIPKICMRQKFDAAILTGPPFFHFLLLVRLRQLGVATILDYRDGWATDPYPFRSLKDRALRWFGKLVEPLLYRRASAAVFISESLLSDHLSLVRLRDSKKAFVVPNGVDVEEFERAPAVDLKSSLAFPADVRLFLYLGTLSPDIGADSFARNLNEILRDGNQDPYLARFVFVGHTTDYARYFDSEVLSKYIRFLPPVPLATAYGYMKGANFLLSLAGSEAQRLNRKIFEYAATSKPVLHVGNPNGETARIVRQFNLGVIVPPNDRVPLEVGLREVILDRRERIGEELVTKERLPFTTRQGAERYVEIMQFATESA